MVKKPQKTVTKSELTNLLGMSIPTLNKYIQFYPKFPILKSGGQGDGWSFDLDECLEFIKENPMPNVRTTDSKASVRKMLAQAKREEVKLAVEMKELVRADDMRDALGDSLIRLAKFLESLPNRMRIELGIGDSETRKVAEWLDVERTRLVESFQNVGEPPTDAC
jgi:phage terminase Nu1 subunit (DNA packaging protein)